MDITLQTVKFKESAKLRKFINTKISGISRQYPDAIRIDVTLKKGAANNITNCWCQIYVSHPGENLFVKKNAATYEESISKAVDAMEKIIRRLK